MSHALARLNRQALIHNLSIVRAHCPSQKIWAMVKANAYGHGLQWAVRSLSGVDAFGVATLQEALEVRAIDFKKPIFVMRGFLDESELLVMLENKIGAVVHCWQQIEILRSFSSGRFSACFRDSLGTGACPDDLSMNDFAVWIKIDTGMHRLGFQCDEIPRVVDVLPSLSIRVIGWMTHLAKADVLDSSMTDEQLRLFKASIPVGVVTSIANSAAILAHPLTHGDWVRPGLMLYGVSPFADCSAHRLNLKPVMTVKAPVLAIKGIQAGMGVGYGQAWIAPEDTRIAIVGMGYGDGYPREAQGAVVEIAAKFYPVIGRVSMDLLAIEIGDAPVQLGESVCFWGPSNPIEILSKTVDTIPYTLLTRVSKRVEFCEIEDE